MRRATTVFLWLLLCSAALAQDVSLDVEKRIQVIAGEGWDVYLWSLPTGLVGEERANVIYLDGPAGTYDIRVTALRIDWESKRFTQAKANTTITIGPQPLPPEPEPGPGPSPEPEPSPDPAPIPADGFRVLILRESGATIPEGQLQALNSPAIREYLQRKCPRSADGQSVEYRIWDDDYTDEQMRFQPQLWRDAYAKAKSDAAGKLPWIMISTGKTGTSEPLPATEAETLALLKKYGGE